MTALSTRVLPCLAMSAWGTVALLRRSVRRGIYPAPASPPAFELPDGIQLLRTSGKHPVDVLVTDAPTQETPLVVYFHGNAADLTTDGSTYKVLQRFTESGFRGAAVEYVGYGPHPTASSSYRRIEKSCEEALQLLKMRYPDAPMLLLGHSLGGAFVSRMALKGYGEKAILASPFTSTSDIARREMPYLPPRIFLGEERRLDNLGAAPFIPCPVLVIHGEKDEIFPPSMGRRVAEAAAQSRFLKISDADHSTIGLHFDTAAKIAAQDPSTWPTEGSTSI